MLMFSESKLLIVAGYSVKNRSQPALGYSTEGLNSPVGLWGIDVLRPVGLWGIGGNYQWDFGECPVGLWGIGPVVRWDFGAFNFLLQWDFGECPVGLWGVWRHRPVGLWGVLTQKPVGLWGVSSGTLGNWREILCPRENPCSSLVVAFICFLIS